MQETSTPPDVDLYSLLNVSQTSTQEEIHKAYKSLSNSFHPDKLPPTTSADDREDVQAMFLEFKRANDILMDPVLRLAYDQYGVDGVSLLRKVQQAQREQERRRANEETTDGTDSDDDDDDEEDEGGANVYDRVERLLKSNPLEAKREMRRFMEQHDYHSDLTEQNQVQLACSIEFPPVADLNALFFDGRDYLKFVRQRVVAQARQAPATDREYYQQRIKEEQGLVDYQVNRIKDLQKGSVGFTLSSLQPRNVKTRTGARTPPKWSMAMGASTDVIYPNVREIAKLVGKKPEGEERHPASTFVNMAYQPVPGAQVNFTANLSNDQNHQFVIGTARNFLNRSSHRYSLTFLSKSPLGTNMILNFKSFRHIKDIGMASGGISMGANGKFLQWNAKVEASKGKEIVQKGSAKVAVGMMQGNSIEFGYKVRGLKSSWLEELITVPKQIEVRTVFGNLTKVEAMVTQVFTSIASHPTLSFGLEHDVTLGIWTWVWEWNYNNSSFRIPIPVIHLGTITNATAYYAEKIYYGTYSLLLQSMLADIFQEDVNFRKDQLKQDEEETKKIIADVMSNKKTKIDALRQLKLMEGVAEQKSYEESKRNGLVILEATYWSEQHAGVEVEVAQMDAKVQLQFWVSNGQLTLPAVPKSSLLGFYDLETEFTPVLRSQKWDWRFWRRWTRERSHLDTHPSESQLRIRYTYDDYVYETTVSEHDPVSLPSPDARLMGHASLVR